MRHGNKVNALGRKKGHRTALMRNLANALIEHKRINTTLAKAKALRIFIEPLVTKAKSNSTHSHRVVFSYLQSKDAIKELFGPIAARVGDRPGGYIRILRTGFRKGDAAEMAMIEFVDFNEVYKAGKTTEAGAKKRRTRRGGSATATAGAVAAPAAKVAAGAPVVEDVVALPEVEDAAADIEDVVADETENTEDGDKAEA